MAPYRKCYKNGSEKCHATLITDVAHSTRKDNQQTGDTELPFNILFITFSVRNYLSN